jgi:ABC-type multidrug transport system ATPase subunit
VIEAIDLTARRRGRILLDAVSFDVRPGQVTGVLGGTGAGKSTLLRRMVELERGGGETLFDGRPYRSLRHPMREVGIFLEPGAGHPQRTVRGHLSLVLATDRRAAREENGAAARRSSMRTALQAERTGYGASDDSIAGPWHGLPGHGGHAGRWRKLADRLVMSRGGSPAERIDAVLDIVGLTEQADTRLADLTDGMATRLGIAVALLGDPRALLFDAPERGLEPEGVAWLGALLRAFTGQGRAALVTGSDTETLVGLADRLLLLDSGYLVGTRTAEEVLRAPTGAAVIVRSPQIVRLAAILAESGARSAQGEGACLEVHGLDRARVGDLAYRNGIPVHELSERFTGSDPGDVVLAACSGRNRPIVPFQGFPETASEVSGILASIVASPQPESWPGSGSGSAAMSWQEGSAEGLSAMQPPEALSPAAQLSAGAQFPTAQSPTAQSPTEQSSTGQAPTAQSPLPIEHSATEHAWTEQPSDRTPEWSQSHPAQTPMKQPPAGRPLPEAEQQAMYESPSAESLSAEDAPSTQPTEVGR